MGSGGTTVLVELTPDIHICGICKQHFNNLDLCGSQAEWLPADRHVWAAPSTVQFVSEETVPATQTQTATRTITSETQTITGMVEGGVVTQSRPGYVPDASSDPVKNIDSRAHP